MYKDICSDVMNVSSEPHVPHVLIESGDITPDEYDEFLHGRSDFIKAVKKDGSDLRKVRVPACTWAEEGPPSMLVPGNLNSKIILLVVIIRSGILALMIRVGIRKHFNKQNNI